MTTTIRIDENTKEALNQLGGTFDNPNDVIQRLIEEAGHGELLSSNKEVNEYTANKRKKAFRQRIARELDIVERGKVKGMRSVWKYDTETGIKHLWLHADKNNDYWGWPKNLPDPVTEELIIHVFLGPHQSDCYVVPHEDVMQKFELEDAKEQDQVHRRKQPDLFDQYRSLNPILDYP